MISAASKLCNFTIHRYIEITLFNIAIAAIPDINLIPDSIHRLQLTSCSIHESVIELCRKRTLSVVIAVAIDDTAHLMLTSSKFVPFKLLVNLDIQDKLGYVVHNDYRVTIAVSR